MTRLTQKERVLNYMEEHGGITSADAFKMTPMIIHLPAIIRDLKEEGVEIGDRWFKTENAKYKKYYLLTGDTLACPHCRAVFDTGIIEYDYDSSFRCPVCSRWVKPKHYMDRDDFVDWFVERYGVYPDGYEDEREREIEADRASRYADEKWR